MAVKLANPAPQHFYESGNPLSGGKMYFYTDSANTTPKDTYTTNDLDVANANPVILSAGGLEPPIFLSGEYSVVLQDKNGVQMWSRDNINSVATGVFGTWLSTIDYGLGGDNIVTGSNGLYYISLQTPNLAQNPISAPAYWEQVKFVGVWNTNKTYAISDVVQATDGYLYTALVSQAGNTPVGDDTNWKSTVNSPLVWISSTTASTDATIEFTGISSLYDEYEVHLLNVIPATDSVWLALRTSTDGGSTFDAGATDYSWGHMYPSGSTPTSTTNAGDTEIQLTPSLIGSAANELGVSCVLRLIRPSEATFTTVSCVGSFTDQSTVAAPFTAGGFRASAGDVDAIQFLFESGNVASGLFALYGVKRS